MKHTRHDSTQSFLAGITLVAALLSSCGQAGTAVGESGKPPAALTRENDWKTEPWDSDEKPFIEARQSVLNGIPATASNQAVSSYYRSVEKQAEGAPEDAVAVFRQAYAYMRASQAAPGVIRAENTAKVTARLERIASSRSYEFSRLRFILTNMRFPDHRLKKLGDRLLERDPKDFLALFYYLQCLDLRKPDERKHAVPLANKLVELRQHDVSALGARASIHYRYWLVTGVKGDAVRALQMYRDYLGKANLSGGRLSSVQATVNRLEKAAK